MTISELFGSSAPQDSSTMTDPTIIDGKRKLQASAKPVMAAFIKSLTALEQRKVITTADKQAINAGLIADITAKYSKK